MKEMGRLLLNQRRSLLNVEEGMPITSVDQECTVTLQMQCSWKDKKMEHIFW